MKETAYCTRWHLGALLCSAYVQGPYQGIYHLPGDWQGFYHRTRSLISMCFRLFPSSSRRSSVCRFVFPEQPRCLSTTQRCPWGLALEDAFRVTCRCGFVRGHGTSVWSTCPRPQRALASVTSVCVTGLWADLSGCAWSVFLPHCCPACAFAPAACPDTACANCA